MLQACNWKFKFNNLCGMFLATWPGGTGVCALAYILSFKLRPALIAAIFVVNCCFNDRKATFRSPRLTRHYPFDELHKFSAW